MAGSQQTVYEPSDAQYALYYWIYLKDVKSDDELAKRIVRSCAQIEHTAQRVNDPTDLKVGVGFGKQFLEQIIKIMKEKDQGTDFMQDLKPPAYTDWKLDAKTVLPSTGGDIFVHAKGNNVGTLYEFQHLFFNTLPEHNVNVENTKITRGFTYQHHRDISGYMDGIANPLTTEERRNAAVVAKTGGSFVVTQKWEHLMNVIQVERPNDDIVAVQDLWIGRKRENGRLIENMSNTAHVNLMRQVQESNQQIVRQSLPYTEEKSGTGLFFLAYANNIKVFENMFKAMTQGTGDMLFKMSKNTSGTYWYFPGLGELKNLHINMR